MKIRRLQRADYDQVCKIMIEFAQFTGIKEFNQENYNYEHAKNVLLRCEKTGVSLVAQDDTTIQGILLSLCVQDLWLPQTLWLREIAWFVREPYRMTSIGPRLFMEYVKEAKKLQNQGKISGFTMTKLSNSPDFDYERRGFKFCESTYMIGQ